MLNARLVFNNSNFHFVPGYLLFKCLTNVAKLRFRILPEMFLLSFVSFNRAGSVSGTVLCEVGLFEWGTTWFVYNVMQFVPETKTSWKAQHAST